MRAFIESLTLRTWISSILPTLLRRRWRGEPAIERCEVFDGSRLGMLVARASQIVTGAAVEPFRFRLVDVRDEDRVLVWFKLIFKDLATVQAQAMEDPIFRKVLASVPANDRLRTYIAHAMAARDLGERQTLRRALFTVRVCEWKERTEGRGVRRPRQDRPVAIAFMERRPWLKVIGRDAAQRGIEVVPVCPTLHLRKWVRDSIPSWLVERLRHLQSQGLSALRRLMARDDGARQRHTSVGARRSAAVPRAGGRIAVEYYGHLNLKHPEQYSDLFFWQASSLPGSALVVMFGLPQDPLDREKWLELTEHGIAALAIHPQATTLPHTLALSPHSARLRTFQALPEVGSSPRSPEARWLKSHLDTYLRQREYWTELFASQHVKVYVSWFKYTQAHCAMADALQSLGGVTAIYHRSYDANPSADTAAAVDILFGFSQAWAEIERHSHSLIPYYVTTGYLGGHRFSGLRTRARAIREGLQQRGARRIMAYCDENSSDDQRWTLGHAITRENYAFLIEKVLKEPWLGLVIKPKVPLTLRRRLGPVAALLERAEATGRCFVFEDGRVQGSYPPAAAALASDLTVHGHFYAATAGVESALAGVPTLLMDREGWPDSPFYRLGLGRVVFQDWQALWEVCVDHWTRPGGVPGFGDWTAMLDELDPFRDGRAAERMGTYLQWLLEGFEVGLARETILADAAERYASRWGKDKIIRMHGRHPAGREATDAAASAMAVEHVAQA